MKTYTGFLFVIFIGILVIAKIGLVSNPTKEYAVGNISFEKAEQEYEKVVKEENSFSTYTVTNINTKITNVQEYLFKDIEVDVVENDFGIKCNGIDGSIASISDNNTFNYYQDANTFNVLSSLLQSNKNSHQLSQYDEFVDKELSFCTNEEAFEKAKEVVSHLADIHVSDDYYIMGYTNQDLRENYAFLSENLSSTFGVEQKEIVLGQSFPFDETFSCYHLVLFQEIGNVKVDNNLLSFENTGEDIRLLKVTPPGISVIISPNGFEIISISTPISYTQILEYEDIITISKAKEIFEKEYNKAKYPDMQFEIIEYRYLIMPDSSTWVAHPVIYFEGKESLVNSTQDYRYIKFYVDAITGEIIS